MRPLNIMLPMYSDNLFVMFYIIFITKMANQSIHQTIYIWLEKWFSFWPFLLVFEKCQNWDSLFWHTKLTVSSIYKKLQLNLFFFLSDCASKVHRTPHTHTDCYYGTPPEKTSKIWKSTFLLSKKWPLELFNYTTTGFTKLSRTDYDVIIMT